MKILLYTNTIFKIGGVARVVTSIANAWAASHDVTIVNTNEAYTPIRKLYDINPNITIHHDPTLYNHDANFQLLENSKQALHDYLMKENFDVIIGVEGKQSIALADALEGIDAEKISWFHNSYEAYFRNKGRFLWKKDAIFKRAMEAYDHLVVLTHHDKKCFDKAFDVDSTVIFNPIPFEIDHSKRHLDHKMLLTVGRLKQPAKGFDLGIRSLKPVLKRHPDWTWHIVGSGPDEAMIHTLIHEANIDNHVIFHGARRHVKSFYKDASIFVLPSRWEGLPMVSLEAMSCGLPLVGFDIDALTEVLGSRLGQALLVPQYTTQRLTQTILSLIEDEEQWSFLSNQVRLRAQHFSLERILFEWDQVFVG